ncbi:MAG: hypothetical protein LBV09_01180 [Deferribacteraceae bacterium]|nr:hypothetical protein [Deferribacteraceae bacterium]
MKIFITSLLMILIFTTTGISQSNVSLIDIQAATQKIKDKEKTLLEKEQQLNAKEEKLNALEQDLIAREESMQKIRDEIAKEMSLLSTSKNAEIDSLAKLYNSTKPKAAASVLVKLEPEQAAAILSRIPVMNAGKILAEMAKQDAEYTSKLTARMAGDETAGMTQIIIQQ